MIIIADDKIPFLKGVFEPYAEMKYLPGARISREDVRDASAIITRTRTLCDSLLLDGSAVRVIASATIGYDHIDTAYCDSRGIVWSNAPGCNSSSVCQYIGSVLVELAEKFGFGLADRTLGVVGVGNVGSKVAALARQLGMKVLLCDPPKGLGTGFEEIVNQADIITLHVPLDGGTRHLVDAGVLSKMNGNQILVNSSRGAVVDNAALKDALRSKSLKAAVLDVWEGEPEVDRELLDMVTIATPHIAGYSADGKAAGTTMAVRQVARTLGIEELEDWSAECALAPEQPLGAGLDAELDCKGKTKAGVLSEALRLSYNVMEDDMRFRQNPELFERLRGDYPVRREYPAYMLRLKDADADIAGILSDIGFTL